MVTADCWLWRGDDRLILHLCVSRLEWEGLGEATSAQLVWSMDVCLTTS